MTSADRKALINDYKDRETIAGVFAVICSATGRAWVGASRHIDTQQNGLWFALKMGGTPTGRCRLNGPPTAPTASASSNWTACRPTCPTWRARTN